MYFICYASSSFLRFIYPHHKIIDQNVIRGGTYSVRDDGSKIVAAVYKIQQETIK